MNGNVTGCKTADPGSEIESILHFLLFEKFLLVMLHCVLKPFQCYYMLILFSYVHLMDES